MAATVVVPPTGPLQALPGPHDFSEPSTALGSPANSSPTHRMPVSMQIVNSTGAPPPALSPFAVPGTMTMPAAASMQPQQSGFMMSSGNVPRTSPWIELPPQNSASALPLATPQVEPVFSPTSSQHQLGSMQMNSMSHALFDAWDVNKDGKITHAEWAQIMMGSTKHTVLDKDRTPGGGAQTAEELRRFEAAMHEIFQLCDTSGRGRISKGELIRACRQKPMIGLFFGIPAKSTMDEVLEVFQQLKCGDDYAIDITEFQPFCEDCALRNRAAAAEYRRTLSSRSSRSLQEDPMPMEATSASPVYGGTAGAMVPSRLASSNVSTEKSQIPRVDAQGYVQTPVTADGEVSPQEQDRARRQLMALGFQNMPSSAGVGSANDAGWTRVDVQTVQAPIQVTSPPPANFNWASAPPLPSVGLQELGPRSATKPSAAPAPSPDLPPTSTFKASAPTPAPGPPPPARYQRPLLATPVQDSKPPPYALSKAKWRVVSEEEELRLCTKPLEQAEKDLVPSGWMYEAAHAAPPIGNFFGNLLCSLGLVEAEEGGGGDLTAAYDGAGQINWTIRERERERTEVKTETVEETSSYVVLARDPWDKQEQDARTLGDIRRSLEMRAPPPPPPPIMPPRAVPAPFDEPMVASSASMAPPPPTAPLEPQPCTPRPQEKVFIVHEGYLVGGDDLLVEKMTPEEAKIKAAQLHGCAGFTYEGSVDSSEPAAVYFKNRWNFAPFKGWTSLKFEEPIQVPEYKFGQKQNIPFNYFGPPAAVPAATPSVISADAQSTPVPPTTHPPLIGAPFPGPATATTSEASRTPKQTAASPTSITTKPIVRALPVAVPITVMFNGESLPVAVPNVEPLGIEEPEIVSVPASQPQTPGPEACLPSVRSVSEAWVEPEEGELRALEISSMGEVAHLDLMSFVKAMAASLSRGHEAIVKAIFTFFEVQLQDGPAQNALQGGKVVRSNFPAFEFRVTGPETDEIERILIEIDIQKRPDFFWVSYKSRCSWSEPAPIVVPPPPKERLIDVYVQLPQAAPAPAPAPPPPMPEKPKVEEVEGHFEEWVQEYEYQEQYREPRRASSYNLNSVFDV